jgi:uncharacterized protein
MFEKQELTVLKNRIAERRQFIQVIMGPRQVGKTTLVRQLLKDSPRPFHFAAADAVPSANAAWIEQQWEAARFKLKTTQAAEVLLVIDEIQKIDNWAEIVKAHWDNDTFNDIPLKVILLGSSRLLLQHGLSEALAGRFEVLPLTHWTLNEMQLAFGFTTEQFIWFGGYPGAASLINDETRWREYVLNSLVETTLSKDILMLTRVDKPALLRQLFELGCSYSGQMLSLTKLMGRLQEAGNTTTLSYYLSLLDSAGLLSGLERYALDKARQRASIPKWQVHNMALMSALAQNNKNEAESNPEVWGRYVESAVGVHLTRAVRLGQIELFYWHEGNDEVDFVIKKGAKVIGIEVKGGRTQKAQGMAAFQKKNKPEKVLLVGNSGIALEDFLKTEITVLF